MNEENSFIPNLTLDPVAETAAAVQEAPAEKKEEEVVAQKLDLSSLSPAEQDLLMETIESEQTTPSLSQAQKMRKMSKEGSLNEDTMLVLMQAQKKPEGMDIVLRYNEIKEFFPKAYTPLQMKNGIMKLLENFRQAQIKRARNQQSR